MWRGRTLFYFLSSMCFFASSPRVFCQLLLSCCFFPSVTIRRRRASIASMLLTRASALRVCASKAGPTCTPLNSRAPCSRQNSPSVYPSFTSTHVYISRRSMKFRSTGSDATLASSVGDIRGHCCEVFFTSLLPTTTSVSLGLGTLY